MTTTPKEIQELLAEADRLQEQARQLRIEAGHLLLKLQHARPGGWRGRCGISKRMETVLIEMATGKTMPL